MPLHRIGVDERDGTPLGCRKTPSFVAVDWNSERNLSRTFATHDASRRCTLLAQSRRVFVVRSPGKAFAKIPAENDATHSDAAPGLKRLSKTLHFVQHFEHMQRTIRLPGSVR